MAQVVRERKSVLQQAKDKADALQREVDLLSESLLSQRDDSITWMADARKLAQRSKTRCGPTFQSRVTPHSPTPLSVGVSPWTR